MHLFILFIHILLSLTTIIASLMVFISLRREQSPKKSLVAMWSHFAGVTVTGAALVFMTPGVLGHACLLVAGYVVLTSTVQLYVRRVAAAA